MEFQVEQIHQFEKKMKELQEEADDRNLIIRFLEGKKERLEAGLNYFQQENSHLQTMMKEQLKKFVRLEKEVEKLRCTHG